MKTLFNATRRYFRWKFLHSYALGKILLDPVYAEVARMLAHSALPLLDLGCGVGLLASYLRTCGHRGAILGLDVDEKKIGIARKVLGNENVEFQTGNALEFPSHAGDVVLLDVLHYFTDDEQQRLLRKIATSLAPNGMALIRVTLNEPHWRFTMTCLEEKFITFSGWISRKGLNFPTRSEVETPFLEAGLPVEMRPLWGITPFNSYLLKVRCPV